MQSKVQSTGMAAVSWDYYCVVMVRIMLVVMEVWETNRPASAPRLHTIAPSTARYTQQNYLLVPHYSYICALHHSLSVCLQEIAFKLTSHRFYIRPGGTTWTNPTRPAASPFSAFQCHRSPPTITLFSKLYIA